jgi:hypothetical protein
VGRSSEHVLWNGGVRSGSELFPTVGFVNSCVEPLGSVATLLVNIADEVNIIR